MRARAAFDDLIACANRQVDPKYRGFIHNIRNKVMAHYDDCFIDRAIERRAERSTLRLSSLTLAEDFAGNDYQVASDIEETVMVRYICKIPDSTGPKAATEAISDLLGYANGLAFKYVRFCAEFVLRCMDDFGAIK